MSHASSESASEPDSDSESAFAGPQRIALFGFHRSAVDVAAYLRKREHQLLIIDDDEGHLTRAREQGYEVAKLDYHDDKELEKLGLGRSLNTVFCLFPDDAENVFLTISIRALARRVRIITIAHDPDTAPTLRAAGADKVIDVHEIAGRRIWNLIRHPFLTDLLENTLFGHTPLNLAEIPVQAGSVFDGVLLRDLTLASDYNVIVTGVSDQGMAQQFIVTTEGYRRRLMAGDTLLVIGPAEAIERLRADVAAGERPAPA